MRARPVIVIDAGHGGHDSGAVGPAGLREADVNLAVANLVAVQIRTWASPVMTRRDDRFIELDRRAMIANDAHANAVVSIHCNAGGGSGVEVYTTPGRTPADALATDLFNAITGRFPDKPRRMDLSDGDADKEARFAVLRLTHARAVLVEMEFIDTPEGEGWLADPRNLAGYAVAIAGGLHWHFTRGEGAAEE